jgi:hypothetical protein
MDEDVHIVVKACEETEKSSPPSQSFLAFGLF